MCHQPKGAVQAGHDPGAGLHLLTRTGGQEEPAGDHADSKMGTSTPGRGGAGLFSLFLLLLSLLFLPPFSVLVWNPGPSPARQSSVTKPHPQPSPNNF